MEDLYLAFVDTPGLFASLIRKTIRIPYVHVVLSLDPYLEEAYSIGRRHPSVPLLAGFEREDSGRILKAFPSARYRIVRLGCTKQQKEALRMQLEDCYKNRFHYHYCIAGLPFLLLDVPFYQKNHYTCSSFLAKLLSDNGIDLFQKHFSLVTPRDFYELSCGPVLFEGTLASFLTDKRGAHAAPLEPAYET